MKKLLMLGSLGVLVLSGALLSGCTDTTLASYEAYGKPHEISVFQYDKEIYHGFSTGRVKQSSHDVQFMDKDTRELVDISLGQSATLITKVLP